MVAGAASFWPALPLAAVGCGGQAVADYGNVAKQEDAKAMVQKAVDSFGKLDFMIANAGILRDKSFKNMTDDMWDIVIDVHLRGT